jgi:hypothetical protein
MATEIDWRNVKHAAAPRNERRILIEIDVEPSNGMANFEQNFVQGKQYALIYASELERLQKLTQTEEHRAAWKHAEKLDEGDLAAALRGLKDEKQIELARARHGGSAAAYFCKSYPTGMPPVRSFRVLDDNVPPPETTANLQANQMDALAATLAKLLNIGQQPQPARR